MAVTSMLVWVEGMYAYYNATKDSRPAAAERQPVPRASANHSPQKSLTQTKFKTTNAEPSTFMSRLSPTRNSTSVAKAPAPSGNPYFNVKKYPKFVSKVPSNYMSNAQQPKKAPPAKKAAP